MAISRTTQAHLAKGDFDAVESDWLAQMGEDLNELDYFVGVARALAGNGQEGRARVLLEMLDEQLRDKGFWALRLKLLQRTGQMLLAAEKLHNAILATLDRLYTGRSTYKGLKEAVGLSKAAHDIPKTWEKVERLQGLLAFDVGTVVYMEGRGAGKVAEANLGLESFKVDFERFKGLTVGFKAAAKLLHPLPVSHVLRRKLEDPKGLAGLPPSELLKVTLQSYNRPLTATEIREALAGLVKESEWTSWWSAARKHPQVVAGAAGRQTYAWAETSGDALDSVWKTYARAEPRKKIELLKREGLRNEALRERMAVDLSKIAETAAAGRDPGLAFEIWFALERTGGAPADVAWAPEELLEHTDLQRLFVGIEDRLLRERAYTMLRERREDWAEIYALTITRESDPRVVEMLAQGLAQAAPRDYERFLDNLLIQPHRMPAAFTWLAEKAATDEALRTRNPLRFLQQLLSSLARDEFAPFRLRLQALAESGSTVPRLLVHLTEDQAPQAVDAVHRAAGLEAYQRDQLATALELRFSSLRKEDESAAFYATPESIDVKRAELKQIMAVDIPANRKAIEEARAMGDLRENFEYKSARQRHEYLNSRAASLNSELSRVRPIDTAGTDISEVRIGSMVRLTGATGERTITLLGPWESKPEEDILSYESDLAKQLIGKGVGAEVDLGGTTWKVAGIEPYK
jgi:transcription elongation GreA/GreB family factor